MDLISWLTEIADAILIAPYRWPQDPIAGWWLGTFILSVWVTIAGQATLALAFRINRSYVLEANKRMVLLHHQSINALKAGDKGAYKGINKLANEAYGKSFFLQVAMAASSLWPVAFALAWMQSRFSHIRFPLPVNLPWIGDSVSYPFVFLPLYILTRIVFGKLKRLLIKS